MYDRACGLLTGSCDDAGEISEVWKYTENFNERGKHFVDIHEQYYSLLRDEFEREYACSIYEGQERLKWKFDEMVSEWRTKQDMAKLGLRDTGVRGSRSGKSTKSLRGENSDGGASSRISRQSRRREKMALAQLKLDQIKKRQILEREEQELRRKRELMEAEMEAQKAVLSFQIMSEFEDQSSSIIRADEVTIKPKELSSPGKLAIEIEEKKTAHEIDNKVETEDKCNITPDVQRENQRNPTPKPVGLENAKQTTGQQFS